MDEYSRRTIACSLASSFVRKLPCRTGGSTTRVRHRGETNGSRATATFTQRRSSWIGCWYVNCARGDSERLRSQTHHCKDDCVTVEKDGENLTVVVNVVSGLVQEF